MSAPGNSIWLRAYPPAWRARYGEELEDVIRQSSQGHVAWSVRGDLLRAGATERLRSWGFSAGEGDPAARAKAGALLVLCAWALAVVAGLVLQKSSEHWQAFDPAPGRGLSSGAFQTLLVAALAAGTLVIVGGACALPRLVSLLRKGGWVQVRRPVIRALLVSALAILATVGLIVWAHHLDAPRRNGHAPAYAVGFVFVGLLVIASVATWTAAAVVTIRRLEISVHLLELEVTIAVLMSAAMATMTVATLTWWAALAIGTPGAPHEPAGGAGTFVLQPQLLAAMLAMVLAAGLACCGAVRALRAVQQLSV